MLREQYEGASLFRHSGTIGTSREDGLKQVLREVLPNQFGIESGEIDSELGRSKQIDIIIYDATMTNGYSVNNNSKIVPGYSVKAIIEVKSKLSKGKMLQGIHNIESALKVVPPSINIMKRHLKPFNTIFAYELDRNSLKSLAGNLNEIIVEKPGTPVNLVTVLSEGLIHFDHDYLPFNYVPIYNSTRYGAFPLADATLQQFCEIIKSQVSID
jgi:hypothetical protein